MKLFIGMCCTALFNMLFGMQPQEKVRPQDREAQQAYKVYINMRLDDLVDAVSENRATHIKEAKLVVQAKFLADSIKLQRRLDTKSEVDPHFGTSDILIDPATIARCQSFVYDNLLEKKNQ